MGRFASAKANGDTPTVLQRAINYLIDLLDREYSVSTTINGKEIKIVINPSVGISILVDGVQQFGVDSTGSVFATKISSPSNPTNYGIIGDYPGLGSGLALYDLDLSADPYFQLTATLDAFDNQVGIGIYDTNDVGKVFINLDGTILLTNVDNTKNIFEYNGTSKESILRYGGATDNALGVDATGVYKIIGGGAKTYL